MHGEFVLLVGALAGVASWAVAIALRKPALVR